MIKIFENFIRSNPKAVSWAVVALFGIVICIISASTIEWGDKKITFQEEPLQLIVFSMGLFAFFIGLFFLRKEISKISKQKNGNGPSPKYLCHTCYGLLEETIDYDMEKMRHHEEVIYQDFKVTKINKKNVPIQYLWADAATGNYINGRHCNKNADNYLRIQFNNKGGEYSNIAIRPLNRKAFNIKGIEKSKIVVGARISPEVWNKENFFQKVHISLRLVNGYHEHIEVESIFEPKTSPDRYINKMISSQGWEDIVFDPFDSDTYRLMIFGADGNIHHRGSRTIVSFEDMNIISCMVLSFFPHPNDKEHYDFLGSVDIRDIKFVKK